MKKKKFRISSLDKNVLKSAQEHCGGGQFAAEITIEGDHWSVEVVDWFEFYRPSATPYDAHREVDKQYAVVINKTLIFHQVKHVYDFLDTHYGRADAVGYLFDQVPHRVLVGDHRSMVFIKLQNDMKCRIEAIWKGDVLDREHVAEIRIIFERGAT